MKANSIQPIRMLFEPLEPFPKAIAPFLKEVGRGKRGAKDLTREQAREALGLILEGEASPAQAAAFFQACRIKGESPDELAGMIEATREVCDCVAGPLRPRRVELGLSYDGRTRSFHVAPFAARLAAGSGVQTFFHGQAGAGPKFGVNAIEILYAIGIDSADSIFDAEMQMESDGVAFCTPEVYGPKLARLRSVRNEIVLRGPLATIERMLNLSGASTLIASAFHTPYLHSMSHAFSRLVSQWGEPGAWVLQAAEGHADIDPRRATMVQMACGGRVEPWRIDPKKLDLRLFDKDEIAPPRPPVLEPLNSESRRQWIEANVDWGMALLAGKSRQGLGTLLWTTALLLRAGGIEGEFAQAIEAARALWAEESGQK